jgi:hypothetical protein
MRIEGPTHGDSLRVGCPLTGMVCFAMLTLWLPLATHVAKEVDGGTMPCLATHVAQPADGSWMLPPLRGQCQLVATCGRNARM